SDGGKGHDGMANVVHVHVDAAERAAVNGDAGFALLYAATHLLKNVDETDVALEAVLGQAGDGDAAAEDRGGGPEIGGGGGVGFDGIPSWTVVSACRSAALGVSPHLPALVVPQPHHGDRHLDVGLGHKGTLDPDCDRAIVIGVVGGRHEEAAEELATDFGPNSDCPASLSPVALNNHWRTPVPILAIRSHSVNLVQRVEQVLDGSLTHARDTIKAILSLAGRN